MSIYFRQRQIKGSAGRRNRGFALNDLDNKRCFALRCPAFDVLVHGHTHCYFLPYSMSRFSVGRYNGGMTPLQKLKMAA